MPTLTKIGRNTIHDSAISTAQLEDGSVAVADIGTNAVGNDELINSESYTIGGLTSNGASQIKGQLTLNSTTGNYAGGGSGQVVTFPTNRGTTNQVLKISDQNTGALTWSAITVSGYDGVAWDYDIRGGGTQTIALYKAVVVPGPMIITDGTVVVNGRLHVI